MTSSEAAAVIRAMSRSLSTQPGQFRVEVSVSGQNIVSHGGTGLNISVRGGGPGSTTVGQKVSATVGDVEIRQANTAFDSQIRALTDTLDKIANELEAHAPDDGKVSSLYASLRDTWVPGVVTSVIANVIGASLGIGV